MRKNRNRAGKERLGLMKLAMLILLSIVIVAGIIYFLDITPEQLDTAAEQLVGTPRPTSLNQTEETSPTNTPISSSEEPDEDAILPESGKLSVVFMDVGNADCIFVRSPSGKTMLIDAGESDDYEKIDSYLKRAGVTRIDVLVATHPHNDHIGGMRQIVENYEIGAIYMPRVTHNTSTYENLLEAISDKGMKIKTAKGGDNSAIDFDSSVSVRILAPLGDDYSDLNNYSAVLRLDYNNSSFLLAGDAGSVSEKEMLKEYPDLLRADVLKVGHHGSSDSTTEDFLAAVDPTYAVISCDSESDGSHPSAEVIERLKSAGVEYYRTDLFGTIVIVTDGKTFDIRTEYYGN